MREPCRYCGNRHFASDENCPHKSEQPQGCRDYHDVPFPEGTQPTENLPTNKKEGETQ